MSAHPTQPLRAALAGTLPPWKGVSPYCSALAQALAARPGLDLTFLDFEQLYPAALYPGASMTQPGGKHVASHPAGHPFTHRRELHYARPDDAFKIGRDLNADVLHVQFWSEFLAPTLSLLMDGFHAAATAGRPRPVVLTLHNLAPHEDPTALPFLQRISQSWKEPFGEQLLRRADAWIVHYTAGRSELAQRLPGVSANRIHVIPHGLLEPIATGNPAESIPDSAAGSSSGSSSSLSSKAAARSALSARLSGAGGAIAPDEFLLLLFGNLRPYKGVDIALRALALCATPPNRRCRLLIAGSPWKDFDLAAMQTLATELGVQNRVDWLVEFIPDPQVATLLAAADALILPYTRFDAMSGVASLALRAGLPAIVSRVGGLAEMLPPALHSDLVVPPGDPAALARAITSLMTNQALQAAAANPPGEFLRQFQWPAIAQRTVELYRSLLPDIK